MDDPNELKIRKFAAGVAAALEELNSLELSDEHIAKGFARVIDAIQMQNPKSNVKAVLKAALNR